jgi:hypothetical protein
MSAPISQSQFPPLLAARQSKTSDILDSAFEGLHTGGGVGLVGRAVQGTGVLGIAADSEGSFPPHDPRLPGAAVGGMANQSIGIMGQSVSQPGIIGTSLANHGVQGEAHAADHAGVVGINNTGFGVLGRSVSGKAGRFEGDVDITGRLNVASHLEIAGTLTANSDLIVKQTLNVAVDVVLTGADCAEDFDLADKRIVDPGSVMVFDIDGALRLSDRAYDRCVAGVISGAGEYRPGMLLDRRPRAERPRCTVALVGKVYCKADARYGHIGVGDLLTTSPTLGHAMKATDDRAAFGSILGKAMGSLKEGSGLIPVLVALQ